MTEGSRQAKRYTAGNGLPSLGHMKLTDLIPPEGIPSNIYKLSISILSQSMAQFSAAIIQFPASDGSLLRAGLESARLYFHQKASHPLADKIHTSQSREWCKTSGLPDIFALFGKAARDILDAISSHLNLPSSPFTEILDNVPLRSTEVSSSVLSVCCHARPSLQGNQQHKMATQEDGQLVMYPDHGYQDKSLITLVKSDRAGLHVSDFQGQ